MTTDPTVQQAELAGRPSVDSDGLGTGAIPQEAVDAAWKALGASMQDALAAALPILRAQWEAEIKRLATELDQQKQITEAFKGWRGDEVIAARENWTAQVAALQGQVDRLTADLAAARQQLDAVQAQTIRECVEAIERAIDRGDDDDLAAVLGELLVAPTDAPATTECTGMTATWCPVHGDCTCDRSDSLSDFGPHAAGAPATKDEETT